VKKIRVLQIGKYYPPYCGGTENHLFTLVQCLKEKLDIKVLVSNTGFKTVIENCNGIEVYRLRSLGSLFSLPLILSLPFWLKKLKADILHFHLPNPISVISYLIMRPKGKIVVSYHSDIIRQRFWGFMFTPLLIAFLKNAQIIIVSSDNLIKNSFILKRFKGKCLVVPHGVDINQLKATQQVLFEANKIKQEHGNPLLLFVGRIVYYKGLEYLLRAMKDVEAKLLIIGSGPLRNKYERLARNLGVEKKVSWLGEVGNKDISPYYHACDVFVLPSSVRAESFGLVQLEAFACEKPVVSTNLPTGVPFVNLDNKTGLVVPPKNSSALTSAIKLLLASQDLRMTYGKNARERVEKEFSNDKMATDILAIYNTLN
jgi:glycosyltransferase involved in cell wall biosynthesis